MGCRVLDGVLRGHHNLWRMTPALGFCISFFEAEGCRIRGLGVEDSGGFEVDVCRVCSFRVLNGSAEGCQAGDLGV